MSGLLRDLPRLLRRAEAPDAWIEEKGLAVAVHTRRLEDPDAAFDRLLPVLTAAAQERGLAVEPGRMVIEIRASGMDKGKALRTLVSEFEAGAARLADLALASGQVDVARDGLTRGLRGLPGNEELYRSRLRVEHRAGNLAGVRAAYDELVTYLADLETEPSPATTALYHDLIQPARR